MIFGNQLIEIPDDEPFKNDRLDRGIIAQNLTKIIDSIDESLVLSIDSAWGTGKTTFIKMWEKFLELEGEYKTVYFNAWENDDAGDPLLAIMSQIEDAFQSEGKTSKFEKVREQGKILLKKALPTALKIATHGLLDLKGINLGEFNEGQMTDLAEKIGEVEFKLFKQEKIAKEKFQISLKEYQKEQNKKIVIFIDELDRCRPSFAIETLERIKHIFNINGYVFVLSLDRKQLSNSIATMYGHNMDSVGYLRRFFDIEYLLPIPNRHSYLHFLIDKSTLKNSKTEWFWFFLSKYIDVFEFSLRDIDKLFNQILIFLPLTALLDKEERYKPIYLFTLGEIYSLLICLKIKESETYYTIINKNYMGHELSKVFNNMKIEDNRLPMGFHKDIVRGYHTDVINKFVARNQNNNIANLNEFIVGAGDEFRDENRFDMNLLWHGDNCKVFQDLEFLNYFKLGNDV